VAPPFLPAENYIPFFGADYDGEGLALMEGSLGQATFAKAPQSSKKTKSEALGFALFK
jgi:hypothetical protein